MSGLSSASTVPFGSLAKAVLVGAKTVNGPGPCKVSTRPAAFTAATSGVGAFELAAFWMMFLEGYIGAPPTVTVCSFCCASVGVAATAARASAAPAAAGRQDDACELHVVLHVICSGSAPAACLCKYGRTRGGDAGPGRAGTAFSDNDMQRIKNLGLSQARELAERDHRAGGQAGRRA